MSDLLKVNVNDHVERKNGLAYLSWAWAWAEILKVDPLATWEAADTGGIPCILLPGGTAMVRVTVTVKGHTKACWLPVMDHRNKAIPNPDAFQVNTAIMRCLVKCIALHGLGLYIYAGEDLPEDAGAVADTAPTDLELIGALREAPHADVLEQLAVRAKRMPDGPAKVEARDAYLARKRELGGAS